VELPVAGEFSSIDEFEAGRELDDAGHVPVGPTVELELPAGYIGMHLIGIEVVL
jgi:hypothetical protein